MQTLLHSEIAHFVMYFLFIAIVGGMPAPTATSGTAYKWVFSSLNLFSANVVRAIGPKIENSPNFQAAVNNQLAQAGQPPITVAPPVK